MTFTRAGAVRGARLAVPLGVGSIAVGLVWGLAARDTGLSLTEAVFMSATVFAGASQFVALETWTGPGAFVALVLLTFAVNSRHFLMGAAMGPWFSRLPARHAYPALFFMTDGNWALSLSEYGKGHRDAAILVGSGMIMYVAWVGATAVGHTFGGAVDDPATWGLTFAPMAFFTAVLVPAWRGKRDVLPWLAAGATAVAVYHLWPGPWHVLAGGIAGTVAGALKDAR